MDLNIIVKVLPLLVLLTLSAFFSGSETGLFSLSSVRVHRLVEEKRSGASLISELLSEPRNVLATILLSNLFLHVFSTSLAEKLFARYFGTQALEICIVVMSLVILIFCEIIPKVIAVSRAEKVSLLVVYPLSFFMVLLTPVRFLFLKIANFFIQLIPLGRISEKRPRTTEELKTAIGIGQQEKILTGDEGLMLHGILDLTHRTAREEMTLRDKIFAFEITTPLAKIYDEIRKKKISRVPIYKGDLDHVVGILYAKDLIMHEIVELAAIQIYDLIRPPYFIQESMPLDRLLMSFRTQRSHFALVLNSEKKLLGVITLDDVMEAVIGRSLSTS